MRQPKNTYFLCGLTMLSLFCGAAAANPAVPSAEICAETAITATPEAGESLTTAVPARIRGRQFAAGSLQADLWQLAADGSMEIIDSRRILRGQRFVRFDTRAADTSRQGRFCVSETPAR